MAETEVERLAREYAVYDRCVEIVSCAEVWFRNVEMAKTVRHFERYPVIAHSDGNEARPDFTVVFNDGTGLAAEEASVALEPASFTSLWHQTARYGSLDTLPTGAGTFESVKDVDVVLLVPHRAANRTCDLIEEQRVKVENPPHVSVLEYSHESDTGAYTFSRLDRANNPRPRGHGRVPSMDSWLAGNNDTLRGRPEHFTAVKAERRFANDPVPRLYMAVVLWSQVLGEIAEGERDIEMTPGELVEALRVRFGRGRVNEVKAALDLLKRARLAVETANHWVIGFRELGSAREEVNEVLLRRIESPPRGPITHGERRQQRKARAEKARNIRAQEQLDVD